MQFFLFLVLFTASCSSYHSCDYKLKRMANALEQCHANKMVYKFWSVTYTNLSPQAFEDLVMDAFLGLPLDSRVRSQVMYGSSTNVLYALSIFVSFKNAVVREHACGFFKNVNVEDLVFYRSEDDFKQRCEEVSLFTQYVVVRENV